MNKLIAISAVALCVLFVGVGPLAAAGDSGYTRSDSQSRSDSMDQSGTGSTGTGSMNQPETGTMNQPDTGTTSDTGTGSMNQPGTGSSYGRHRLHGRIFGRRNRLGQIRM